VDKNQRINHWLRSKFKEKGFALRRSLSDLQKFATAHRVPGIKKLTVLRSKISHSRSIGKNIERILLRTVDETVEANAT